MRSLKIIIIVLSLSVMNQFAAAQNCHGKVLMSKGGKGKCGCLCQKQCVDQSEVQAYINMGWYIGQCADLGKLCCGGGWLINNKEQGISQTKLKDIHADSKAVHISFDLSKQTEVNLQVFDVTGRFVASVANNSFKEKSNEVTWDASNVNPGIYLLKMKAGDYYATRKISVTN